MAAGMLHMWYPILKPKLEHEQGQRGLQGREEMLYLIVEHATTAGPGPVQMAHHGVRSSYMANLPWRSQEMKQQDRSGTYPPQDAHMVH